MTRPAVNRYAVADASLPMRRPSKILSFALIVALNRYFRRENGAPERIRTSDRSVRSRVLYPAELRARYTLVRRVPYQGAVS